MRLASLMPALNIAWPNDTAYATTQASFWSEQESLLQPSCIVTPESSHDVAAIVAAFTHADHESAADCPAGQRPNTGHQACQFAIKSQGHAPAAGFANIASPGLTIDLTSLNNVTLSHDGSVASVGAGASWLDVYTSLDPFGKSVAGGRNGAVGVGGLTLGGGISYFSPQVGFTCDTVVNYEIVLASGELVNANASANAELYRALKGGGNNYGIVTKFDFETVNISTIAAGSIVHPSSAKPRAAVFDAFANIALAPEYDVHASLVSSLIYNATAKQWVLLSTPVYTLPVLRPPVFDELYSAPNLTSKTVLTKLSTFADEVATPALNWLFRTGTYGVSAAWLEDIFQICNATFSDVSPSPGSTLLWVLAFEPLPTVFTSRGAGKNVLGTSPEQGDGMIVLISGGWTSTNATESARFQATADQAVKRINAAAEASGMARSFVYANYAGANQDPYLSYGKGNEAFLRDTARKHDPKGIFQRQVPGGFKLGSR